MRVIPWSVLDKLDWTLEIVSWFQFKCWEVVKMRRNFRLSLEVKQLQDSRPDPWRMSEAGCLLAPENFSLRCNFKSYFHRGIKYFIYIIVYITFMVISCVFIFTFSIHLPKLMTTTKIHLPKPTAFHSQTLDFRFHLFSISVSIQLCGW